MSPTAAAHTSWTDDEGPLPLALSFRLGDTWSTNEWAVLIDGAPVDLTAPGWRVHAQARRHADAEQVLAEWSTANGRVRLGTAEVTLTGGGPPVITSTVQLHHGPESRRWQPFDLALIDVDVTRRPDPDADPAADPVESYTIAAGTVTAEQDVSR